MRPSLRSLFMRSKEGFSRGSMVRTPVKVPGLQNGKVSKSQLPVTHISGGSVEFAWPNSAETMNLPTVWLRDHCRCDQCVNQQTMQRAFETFSKANLQMKPLRVETDEQGFRVSWSHGGHVSSFNWSWLASQVFGKPAVPEIRRIHWGKGIKQQPPSVHYDEIMADDAGVGKWTSKILEYGFCFVDGCPVSPEKTEELLERIAFIRFTHYGGFYDFTSDLTMKDTAYTSLALPAHTDTTYFTDPAGLQMFHLLSHTAGEGGQSLLVDGFKCANTLKGLHPEAYELLKTVPVQWHASGNEGIVITPTRKFPVFNHNIEKSAQPGYDLGQIRWNNDDRAALPLWNYQDTNHGIQKWYEAAALWNNIVKSAENEYWEQLVPGRPLIFDNWRVMHGRSAFTGKRRICGGYINRDDFISKYMNTNFSRQEILDRIL